MCKQNKLEFLSVASAIIQYFLLSPIGSSSLLLHLEVTKWNIASSGSQNRRDIMALTTTWVIIYPPQMHLKAVQTGLAPVSLRLFQWQPL